MTPFSQTLYTMTLFLALATLKTWSARRHRVVRVYRGGVAQALGTDRLTFRPNVSRRGLLAPRARSARNQSSPGDPLMRPRASQYEYASAPLPRGWAGAKPAPVLPHDIQDVDGARVVRKNEASGVRVSYTRNSVISVSANRMS